MLVFRLVGYKTYFLDCGSPFWKKRNVIRMLSRIGLIWLDHMEYAIHKPGKWEHDSYAEIVRIGNQICISEGYKWLVKAIGKNAVLQTCVYQAIASDLLRAVELLHTIPMDSKGIMTSKTEVWVPNTVIIRSLLNAYHGVSNRCPRLWTVFELYFHGVGRMLGKVPQLVSIVLKQVLRRWQNVTEDDNYCKQHDNVSDFEDYEVAYFPHQGVRYGNLFLKDHFYSIESSNPFFYEKIIHFEVHGSKSLSPETLEYYREKKIRNEDWQTLGFEKRIAAKSSLSFLAQVVRHRLRGLDVDLLVKFALIFWSVQSHLSRLRNLPKLKIVLIGYDILFPQTLAAACRMQGIKTVTVQERMISAWWSMPLLLDHYFVIGSEAFYKLESTAQNQMSFHELGPIRLKDHAKSIAPDMISDISEKYSWVVLAMDFHSTADWFKNGRAITINWRNNMIFYKHLLRLCHDFPEAFFLLKGKSTEFVRIKFFEDLVSRFRAQPNLLILEDPSIWTPFTSVASADIAVARHTSLADEMLALGKPVIFDDYDGNPSEIYDYGPDVTAYSYDDIRDKLNRFFANPSAYNRNLDDFREKLYYCYDQPVEQVLRKELMAIWSSCRDNA